MGTLIRVGGRALTLDLLAISPLSWAEVTLYSQASANANRRAALAVLGLGVAELHLAPVYRAAPDVALFAETVWLRLGVTSRELADIVSQVEAAMMAAYTPPATPAPTPAPSAKPMPRFIRRDDPPAEALPAPISSEAKTAEGA